VRHKASVKFWKLYDALPSDIQKSADEAYLRLKRDPRHPSLQFKKLGGSLYWSARVTLDYRAIAIQEGDFYIWFWIGPHSVYDRIIKTR
jgi:hypothetical protein